MIFPNPNASTVTIHFPLPFFGMGQHKTMYCQYAPDYPPLCVGRADPNLRIGRRQQIQRQIEFQKDGK
jgi:hypothetical protein